MRFNYGQLLILLWAFGLAMGCTAPVSKSPTVSFESTEAERNKARAAGEPVLLSGHAARFPAGAPNTGWVDLRFVVQRDGSVGSVTVVDASDAVFAAPAVDAVKSWVFERLASDQTVSHRYFLTNPAADHYQPTGNEY